MITCCFFYMDVKRQQYRQRALRTYGRPVIAVYILNLGNIRRQAKNSQGSVPIPTLKEDREEGKACTEKGVQLVLSVARIDKISDDVAATSPSWFIDRGFFIP